MRSPRNDLPDAGEYSSRRIPSERPRRSRPREYRDETHPRGLRGFRIHLRIAHDDAVTGRGPQRTGHRSSPSGPAWVGAPRCCPRPPRRTPGARLAPEPLRPGAGTCSTPRRGGIVRREASSAPARPAPGRQRLSRLLWPAHFVRVARCPSAASERGEKKPQSDTINPKNQRSVKRGSSGGRSRDRRGASGSPVHPCQGRLPQEVEGELETSDTGGRCAAWPADPIGLCGSRRPGQAATLN